MVGGDVGVLAENRAFIRFLDIAFERHQAILAGLGKQFEQQAKQFHVVGLAEFGTFEAAGERGKRVLQAMHGIGGDKCANRATCDHHHLQRLPESGEVAASHGVATKNTAQDHDITNNDEHGQVLLSA